MILCMYEIIQEDFMCVHVIVRKDFVCQLVCLWLFEYQRSFIVFICMFLKPLGLILCVYGVIREDFMYPCSSLSIVFWLLKEEITLWSLYRFNSQPSLGLKAIYDLHYRASYELYADVLLVSIHRQCYQYKLQKKRVIESSHTYSDFYHV